MILRTDINIIEISNGIIKKIKLHDKTFIPELPPETLPKKYKRRWTHRKVPKPVDKGESICTYSGMKIFTNVLANITTVMSHPDHKNRDIRWVLKKYYPDNRMNTLDTKLCIITRYIRTH